MFFEKDRSLASEAAGMFGEYLDTFTSRNGEVRADLFRKGRVVVAHVSFPTGLDANTVRDPYVSVLWQYAQEHNFADQFRVVMS